jgi:hypothetical protein
MDSKTIIAAVAFVGVVALTVGLVQFAPQDEVFVVTEDGNIGVDTVNNYGPDIVTVDNNRGVYCYEASYSGFTEGHIVCSSN